ncbi:protein of unknown function [Stenotrophomonas maltophilia]|nr:protein of unknown function [Stenotrophomonas maltophilia]
MLQACLDATKLTEDALFRRVWRERVRAIALIIQRRVALAGLGGALRRAQPALRLHHRRCASRRRPARPDGDDRSPLGGQCDRLLPARRRGEQPCGATIGCGLIAG